MYDVFLSPPLPVLHYSLPYWPSAGRPSPYEPGHNQLLKRSYSSPLLLVEVEPWAFVTRVLTTVIVTDAKRWIEVNITCKCCYESMASPFESPISSLFIRFTLLSVLAVNMNCHTWSWVQALCMAAWQDCVCVCVCVMNGPVPGSVPLVALDQSAYLLAASIVGD